MVLFVANHSVNAQCLLTDHNPNAGVAGPLTAPMNDCFVLTFSMSKGQYALIQGLTPGNSYTVGNGQSGGLGGINAGGSGTTISVYDHATLTLIPGATASSIGIGPLDGVNVTFTCPPGVTAVRVLINDNPCNGIVITGTNNLRVRCNSCAPVTPPPTTPALQLVNITSPLPGAVNVNTSNVTLNWTATGFAPQYYDLYFDNANGTTLLATVPGNVAFYSFTPANPLTCNTTYTWRVVPRNCWGPATLTVTDVPPSSFTTTIGAPSVSPTLTAPAMNATNVATNATFTWGAVNGATMYDLYLDQVDGTTLFKSNIQATTLALYGTAQYYPLVLPLLNCNTTYFWKVVAKNACGSSLGVSTYVSKFTTMNAVPTCPALTAPGNASVDQLTTPTLTWTASANTAYYDIYLDNLTGPSAGTTLIKSNWNATSFTLPLAMQLLCNTTYTWRVVAKNSCGESQNCTKFTFTTRSGAPVCPVLTAPLNAAINQSSLPTLTWNAVVGATAYDVYLDNLTGPSAATTLLQANVLNTNYPIPANVPLCSGLAYSWRVVAKNACGASTGCTPFTFSVTNPNIACPTLSAPANASLNVSLTPLLSWIAPANVTPLFYDVYLDNGAATTLYASNINTTSLQVPHISPLQCNTLYTWKVFAKNGCGASVGCATFTFTTLSTAPTAPTPSAPANLGLVYTPTPQFTWLAATNAVSYKIYVDPGVVPSPSTLIATIPGNLTQFTIPNASALACGNQYSWRVEAENSCGVTSSIATNSFTVSTPTLCPTHTPANLATNVSTTPLLSWTTVTGATGYDIYLVAGAGTPVPWVTNLNSTQLNYAVPLTQQLLCNQLYTWRVVAKNSCGINTVCANNTFTTVNATTACATLTAPLNAAINASLTPTFTWTAPASPNLASSYDLYLDAGLGGTTFIANIGGNGGANAPNGSVPGSATPPTTYVWPQNAPLLCNTTYTWRIVPRFCGNTQLPVATCPTTFTFTTLNTGATVPTVTSVPAATLVAPICGSGGAVLTASGAAALPGVTYQWLESASPVGPFVPVTSGIGGTTTAYQTPVLTSTMHYKFQVTPINAGACLPVVSTTYTVNVAAPPTISVTPPGLVNYCAGLPTPTAITVTSSMAAATINPAATVTGAYPAYTLTPTATTTYTISTVDPATGCTATVTKPIGVGVNYNLGITATPSAVCNPGTTVLNALDTSALAATTYCVPTFTSTGATGDFINNFTFNTLSNLASGDNASDYALYPQTTTVAAGTAYTITSQVGPTFAQGIGVWIDYNQNGVFEAAEFVISWPSALTANTGTITIPATAVSGTTRLRVGCKYAGAVLATEACAIPSFGEFEDYNITITGGTGTPPAAYNTLPTSAFTWTASTPATIATNPNRSVTASNITAATTFTVTATDAIGCTFTKTIFVDAATPIVATGTTGTTTYCSATPSTSITATISGGSAPFTSVWTGGPVVSTTGLTGVLNPPIGSTTYTVTVSDNCGTSSTTTVLITVNPTPTVAITPGAANVCVGASSTQVASGSGAAPVYTWMPGSLTGASQTLSPIVNTTYTVTSTDGTCSATTALVLTSISSPTFSATTATPSLLCPGDVTSLTTSATLVTGGTGPGAYTIATIPHAPVVPVGPTSAGPIGDDILSGVIALPFPFTFYGIVKNNVYISTNGYISFDPLAGAGCCTGQVLPNATIPNDVIAANWEDLNVTAGQIDYFTFGSAPNRKFVVRWNAATWFSAGGTNVTSQIVLNESDQSIEIHGTSGGPNASNNTTVGIENSTGTLGTAVPGKNSTSPWTFANEAWKFSQQVITPVTNYAWDGGLTGNVVSPALQTTNANPSAATTYTVTATGANGCTATSTVAVTMKPTITGTATASPTSICIGASSTWTGNVPPICGGNDATFAGTYAPATWTFATTNSNGTVNAAGAPANIVLTTGNNNSGTPGYTDYSHSITCAGTVTFNWAYNTTGIPFVEQPMYRINAGAYVLMPGFNAGGANTQSGTASIVVAAGDVLTLSAFTLINDLTTCSVTISNFSAPSLPISGTITWYDAPTAGNLMSAGANPITQTPGSAGTTTYYAQFNTSNPQGCTNPVRIAVPVTVNALPTVTATATPAAICIGGSSVLTGGGASTYVWDVVNANPYTVSPVATTSYTVTGTDGNGCINTASTTVTVNALPTPTATATPASICIGGTTSLNTPVSLTSGPTTNPVITCNPSYSSGNTFGDYINNVTFGAINNTTGVNAVPANTFFATPVVTVNAGSSYPLTVQVGTYTQNDVAVFVDFNRDGDYADAGEKIGEVDNNGANAVVPFTVAIPTTANAGYTRMRIVEADQGTSGGMLSCASYGFGESEDYQLDIMVFPTVAWSGPASIASASAPTTNATPATTGSLTYTVSVTDANGCTGTTTTSLTVNTLPVITANPSTLDTCIGSTITLAGGGAGIGGTYAWSGLITDNTPFTINANTGYTVTGTDANGCSNTATSTVTVTALPTVFAIAGGATTICEGATTSLVGFSPTPAVTFAWSPATTPATGTPVNASPLATTAYTISATDANGCVGTSTLNITVNPKPDVTIASLPLSATVCSGSNITLTASVTNSTSTFLWNPATVSNGVPFAVTSAGIYSVTATSTAGCTSTTSIAVSVNALPVVTATPTTQAVCENGSATVTGGGAGPLGTYAWSGLILDATPFTVTSSATYTVTGTDAGGCSNTATAVVNMNALPTVGASITPAIACNNTSATPTGSGASTYVWSGGLTDGQAFVATTGTSSYTVTGTDGAGCSATSSVSLTVNPASSDLALASASNASSTAGSTNGSNNQANATTLSYYTGSCNLIATVNSGATNLGPTTSTVDVNATTQVYNLQPYVNRWFQITPTTNGPATITFYLTQDDFNDYNVYATANSWPLLPTGPADLTGIGNLVVTKVDNAGFGNNPIVLPPTSVTWNATTSYWEVTVNTPGFSQFYFHSVNPGNAALPATITNFSGRKLNNSDMLEWTTASEQNNAYFNLQHGTDGVNFTTIAKVNSKAANGNSSSILNYNFENTKPQLGHNYYRLQQVDIDNNSTMNAKVVDIIWGTNGSTVSIYPNPTQDVLNIDLYTSKVQNTTVKVLDMSGRIVKQVQARSEAGMNKLSLSLGDIASGVYTVQVFENDQLTHVSKVKKND